jgi:hypothetical protein
MKVQQISIFLENKSGRLASVAATLKKNAVNIRALTIAESENYGVLRMIVNKPEDAAAVLKEAGFMVKLNPVLAAEIDDREGVFYDIMELCDREGMSVEYMYSFVEQASKRAILFLRFEDADAAERLFVKNGYRLLSPEEVCRI